MRLPSASGEVFLEVGVRKTLLYLLMAVAAACGGNEPSASSDQTTDSGGGGGCADDDSSSSTSQDGGDYTADKGTATVSGKVRWEGKPPRRPALDMGADKFCEKCQDGSKLSENTVLGPDGGMRDVFIHVKKGLRGWKFPAGTGEVLLNQVQCQYTPHMVAVRIGQKLRIRNSDPVLHNVHALNATTGDDVLNIGQAKQGAEDTKTFRKPGFFVVKCDVHGWMAASICVVKHPFYAVTAEDGAFSLAKLPAGEYVIEAWHRKHGSQTQTVTVKDGETATLEFVFKKK